MSPLKKFPLWSIALPLLSLLPLAFLIQSSSSILERHIRTVVVNEPAEGLQQMAKGFQGAFESISGKLRESCKDLAETPSLRKAMDSPKKNIEKIADLGQVAGKDFPFLLICDKKGNILHENLGIPRPTPSPSPSPAATKSAKRTGSSKKAAPIPTPTVLFASVKEALGLTQDLPSPGAIGFFSYSGKTFLVAVRAIQAEGKTLGHVLLGREFNDEFLAALQAGAGGDLAVHSQAQTWTTKASLSLPASPDPVTLISEGQDYLSAARSLPDLEGRAPLTVCLYQPIRSSQVLEGSPLESLSKLGWWLLLVTGLLATLLSAFSFYSFKSLIRGLEGVPEGGSAPSLPSWAPGEWGRLADALKGLTASQKEKDRISLILGKVVSPQATKKLLEANDLFALKGEKRECTLLYAELKAFPSLSENMPPPVLVEALNQYFGLINEAVFRQEGMLDRFMGEKALAVWGAPHSHEDKESRAVQAALEIQETLKAFNISRIKKGFPPFTLGIGIHTGSLVAGNLGSDKRHDYTVIGEPLQVAARLCAMASPGQTVVSEETYEKIKDTVKAKPLNPIAVRAQLEPLKTYEILEMQ